MKTRIFLCMIAVGTLLCAGKMALATETLPEEQVPELAETETQEPAQEEEPAFEVVIQRNPRTAPLTSFERQIIEQGFRLLPYDHPFVIAYQRTYKVRIQSYKAEIDGITVSGVPFQFGGSGSFKGFSDSWWGRASDSYYPMRGIDCANFLSWIYNQLDISTPSGSAALFFGGKSGVLRKIPGLRPHYVIPTLDEAMIGDIFYNSEKGNYQSGGGSHTQMYLGTANILGIARELTNMMPNFPCDTHLVLDCGWSDGPYYYKLMQKLKVPNPRQGMGGVGVQFMTTIKSGDTILYECPEKVQSWKNLETLNTFRIESRLNNNGRLLQYNPKIRVEHPMNLSRPIVRPDV